MKKISQTALPFLATMLVLVLSFAMPEAVSMVQDRKLESEVTPIEITVATLEISFYERLQFLSSVYKTTPLDFETEKDVKTAQQAALEAMTFFSSNGFPALEPAFYHFQQSSRRLAVSTDGLQTAILWDYILSDTQGNMVTMKLDAKSGKMISLTFTLSEDLAVDYMESTESDAKRWADACVAYYGFQSAQIQPAYNEMIDGSYRITFTDKGNTTVQTMFFASPAMHLFQIGQNFQNMPF